nr:uncharacterized protein LOC117982594 [Maniola hyperantus]
MDAPVDLRLLGATKDCIVAFGHLKLLKERNSNDKGKHENKQMKKPVSSSLHRNVRSISAFRNPKNNGKVNISSIPGNAAGTSQQLYSTVKSRTGSLGGEEKPKPSQIPRRKSAKELPTRCPNKRTINKNIPKGPKLLIAPRNNVQRVQLLNVDQDWYLEAISEYMNNPQGSTESNATVNTAVRIESGCTTKFNEDSSVNTAYAISSNNAGPDQDNDDKLSQWTLDHVDENSASTNDTVWSRPQSSRDNNLVESSKTYLTEKMWREPNIDDKNETNRTICPDQFSNHDYFNNYCSRKEVVTKDIDEYPWRYRGRCKNYQRYRKTPVRKKMRQPYQNLKSHIWIGRNNKYGWSRVRKRTIEQWAHWARSTYGLRKLRMDDLKKSLIWDTANVQTAILVYRETGTDAVAEEQKSAEITTSLKLNARASFCNNGSSSTSARSTKSPIRHVNIGPSMFPFLYYPSTDIKYAPPVINESITITKSTDEDFYYGVDRGTEMIPPLNKSQRSIPVMTSKGIIQELTHKETNTAFEQKISASVFTSRYAIGEPLRSSVQVQPKDTEHILTCHCANTACRTKPIDAKERRSQAFAPVRNDVASKTNSEVKSVSQLTTRNEAAKQAASNAEPNFVISSNLNATKWMKGCTKETDKDVQFVTSISGTMVTEDRVSLDIATSKDRQSIGEIKKLSEVVINHQPAVACVTTLGYHPSSSQLSITRMLPTKDGNSEQDKNTFSNQQSDSDIVIDNKITLGCPENRGTEPQ